MTDLDNSNTKDSTPTCWAIDNKLAGGVPAMAAGGAIVGFYLGLPIFGVGEVPGAVIGGAVGAAIGGAFWAIGNEFNELTGACSAEETLPKVDIDHSNQK